MYKQFRRQAKLNLLIRVRSGQSMHLFRPYPHLQEPWMATPGGSGQGRTAPPGKCGYGSGRRNVIVASRTRGLAGCEIGVGSEVFRRCILWHLAGAEESPSAKESAPRSGGRSVLAIRCRVYFSDDSCICLFKETIAFSKSRSSTSVMLQISFPSGATRSMRRCSRTVRSAAPVW